MLPQQGALLALFIDLLTYKKAKQSRAKSKAKKSAKKKQWLEEV